MNSLKLSLSFKCQGACYLLQVDETPNIMPSERKQDAKGYILHDSLYTKYADFVVQLCNCVKLFATPCTVARQASLSLQQLKLMSIESVMPSNQPILSCPLLLLPSIFPSIRV